MRAYISREQRITNNPFPKLDQGYSIIMLRARKKIQITLSIMLLCFGLNVQANTWHPVAPGIDYLCIPSTFFSQWSHIHVFRIDLHYQDFEMIMTKTLPNRRGSAYSFLHHSSALIAVNGGFFNPKRDPLGLRISDHHIFNPLKPISWWGIFGIKHHTASITTPTHLQPDLDFAIQSGPRLLIKGEIPPLRPGYANRSALGIDTQGKVILLVTESMPMTTTDLAEIMKKKPLSCVDAINLDGGSSSQLYAKIGLFKVNVPSVAEVSDGIVIKPRTIHPLESFSSSE